MTAKNLKAALAGAGLSAALLTAPSAMAQGANPGTWIGWVPADASVEYYEYFYAGEWAEIVLDGSCESDIDLWVYDAYGVLVAKSTSYGCYEHIQFVPDYSETYTIVVENHRKPNGSSFELTTI